jgi:hypothetical protein
MKRLYAGSNWISLVDEEEEGGNSEIKLLSIGCEGEFNFIKVMLSHRCTVVAMR